ncbi:hypothetical protein BC826DRAFT_410326 [Russula brevipes]|nr:hypothetical protein BC826DRAFT_410326 [Russula brevipes]
MYVESSELDTPPVTRVSLHKDHRDLSHNMHTAPSELVKPDPKLACTEVSPVHGRMGSDSSANRVVPLTSTDGYPTTITGEAAPVVVSATSIRVKFREDVSPTLPLDVPDSPGVHHTPVSNGHFLGAPEATRGLARSTDPLATQELFPMSDFLTCDPDSSQRITTSERLSRQTPRRTTPVGSGNIAKTKYTDMVFENVPLFHSILATFFTWLVRAGLIVLPNTFTTLEAIGDSATGEMELPAERNLPLLCVAYGCSGVGGIGMCILWWRWSHNYVWLLRNIFIPGVMSGVSGVISTVADIYGTENGSYSIASIAALAVTGACMVICGALSLLYMFWKLRLVKVDHDRRQRNTHFGNVFFF